ncbi:zinc-dependent alcohol dehydrogenase family protein [Alicyclobacillus sp. SO9]|nr:zinc-dependent alcohol dehydrogenase family protein [Alicyclobacillus sp. SO9]
MRAFVVHGPRDGRVEIVPYPTLTSEHDMIVRVHSVGICGTDQHIFDGEFLSPYPIIPGHEFSGIVEEVGAGVDRFQPGDRVSVDPTLYCGGCEYCLTNRFNHCEHWGAIGNTTDGALAEYVAVPAKNAVKMPDEMTFEQGAFVEPIACVVHGMNRLQVRMGDSVLLFGVGAMGLQLIQALAHAGASELVVVDVEQTKLDTALKYGATRGILSETSEAVLSHSYPKGFDIVVDVTGIPQVIQTEFKYLGKTGKFLQFGVTPQEAQITVNPFEIYNQDWTILGSMAINNTFIPAFQLLKEGRIDIGEILTHTISLDEVPELLSQPKDKTALKVQVELIR